MIPFVVRQSLFLPITSGLAQQRLATARYFVNEPVVTTPVQ